MALARGAGGSRASIVAREIGTQETEDPALSAYVCTSIKYLRYVIMSPAYHGENAHTSVAT